MLAKRSTGLDQAALLREPDARSRCGSRSATMIARRAEREPLAYILGWQEFWSLRFAVSPATLIPRADSETLIEAALAARPGGGRSQILDLGTGTGLPAACHALSEMSGRHGGVGVDRESGGCGPGLSCQCRESLGFIGSLFRSSPAIGRRRCTVGNSISC